jgi:hypothetical protein
MPEILALVSPEKIMALPWHIQFPGIAIVAILVIAAFWALLKLQPVRALGRLVTALAVAIILAQGGEAITRFVAQYLPASGQ